MRIRNSVTILLVSLALGVLIAGLVATSINAQEAGASPNQYSAGHSRTRLLESSTERIVFNVQIPDYAIAQQMVDGKPYDAISIPDWGLTSEAGAPQLPIRRVLLGIPLDAEVQLRVVEAVTRTGGPYDVLPAPETIFLTDASLDEEPSATPPEFERRFAEAPEFYGANAFYPETIARLGEVGFIRHQRVAAIELYPVQYNPVSGEVRFHPEIQIELNFSQPFGRQAVQPAAPEGEVYEQLLDDQLLNYASAKAWRGSAPPTASKHIAVTAPGQWPLPSLAYKIPITQDGLYQITYEQLSAAGSLPGNVDPDTLQMFWSGEEIAIQVEAGMDGSFDSGDYVLFYGQGIQHKYTDKNVYWLTYGQSTGRRMPRQQGELAATLPTPLVFTDHLRIEEEVKYQNRWPGDDWADRWYWVYLNVLPEDASADVDLKSVSTEVVTASLWASMWGYTSDPNTSPDHHAEFYVNGNHIGDHWWDGNAAAQWVKVDFPNAYLISGTNTLSITVPGDTGAFAESVMFDRFELDYGRAHQADANQLTFSQTPGGARQFQVTGFTTADVKVYDITEPVTVTRLVSAVVEPVVSTYTVRFTSTVPTTSTYLALTSQRRLIPPEVVLDSPSNLRGTANGADYIVVSYADFLPAADVLADHRALQGLRTMVVDLEDVYDEFGYGVSSPEAIRSFLSYAFENWQPPAPTYVVLMGDGTYDPKDNRNLGDYNNLSPYLAAVDNWLNETAADNRYVSISGDDIWPDIVLGRMPVSTLAEAETMVSKTITYEKTMQGADWNSHLVFVAGRQPDPKGAGNFHDVSDELIQGYVPASYDVSRVYLGTIEGSTCATGGACQQQLVDLINSPGALLINYIGHAARDQWSEDVLDLDAIDLLTNSDRFPVMLPMTCLDGYFILPGGFVSLSEGLVRAAERGAVASWAPTGLGVAHGHDFLNKGFLEAVLLNGVRELGPATYAGKWRLYNAGVSLEQIEEYTLFGDPALQIPALDLTFLYLPTVVKQFP
jgi:hypothetical protein